MASTAIATGATDAAVASDRERPALLGTRFGAVADGVVLPPLGDPSDDEPLTACIAELRRIPEQIAPA